MALSRDKIKNLWVAQGGHPKYADFMAGIALRESGGRPKIDNRGLNKNGTVDWGLYQVNDIWRKDPVVGKLFRSGAIMTAKGATQAAIRIAAVQGLGAWASSGDAPRVKLKPGTPQPGTAFASPSVKTTRVPGVDNSTLRRAAIANFVTQGGTDNDTALLALATELPSLKDTPSRTVKKIVPGTSSVAPTGGGTGAFKITGPNPGRLNKPIVAFARRVAGVLGKPLTGSDGTGHSYYVAGTTRVSQHSTGDATDIPLAGRALTEAGQAALVAAGMPKAQAMKAGGGIYNVNGKQIIFNAKGHYDHLHLGS